MSWERLFGPLFWPCGCRSLQRSLIFLVSAFSPRTKAPPIYHQEPLRLIAGSIIDSSRPPAPVKRPVSAGQLRWKKKARRKPSRRVQIPPGNIYPNSEHLGFRVGWNSLLYPSEHRMLSLQKDHDLPKATWSRSQMIETIKNSNWKKPYEQTAIYIYIYIADSFYVVRARREQCGAAQGSGPTNWFVHISRAGGVCPHRLPWVVHKLWDQGKDPTQVSSTGKQVSRTLTENTK